MHDAADPITNQAEMTTIGAEPTSQLPRAILQAAQHVGVALWQRIKPGIHRATANCVQQGQGEQGTTRRTNGRQATGADLRIVRLSNGRLTSCHRLRMTKLKSYPESVDSK